MSAYQVAKLCRRCLREPDLRQAVLDDPRTALQVFDLTDFEREALLSGDVRGLHDAGCSAFLLSYLPRWGLFGLEVPLYADRMRRASDAPCGSLDIPSA